MSPGPASEKEFIERMPKAELHVHVEGTLEPGHMLELAERNGTRLPYADEDAARAAYRFGNLDDFLKLYYRGMSVLRSEEDFFELTYRYLERAHAQNVTHVEMFFDPQGHTNRGIAFDTVLKGVAGALAEGEKTLGVSSKLIMCFLRHLPENEALDTLEKGLAHRTAIHGVGLDSSERDHPPGDFARVFARARDAGFAVVAHAGEEGPAAYVRDALDLLHVQRIDHGNRAMDDPELVRRLAHQRIALTVCPLSNLRLGVVASLGEHPLREMLARGLRVTVNSDDPAYFGGYVNENFLAVHEALDLSLDEIKTLAINAYLGSFLDSKRKLELLSAFDRFAKSFEEGAQASEAPSSRSQPEA